MQLNSWESFVVFCKTPPHVGRGSLDTRARMHCPMCRNIVDILVPEQKIFKNELPQKPWPVEEYQYRILACLKQNRACEVCGIVSTLPKKEELQVRKELARDITPAWIEEQLRALGAYQYFAEAETADYHTPDKPNLELISGDPAS